MHLMCASFSLHVRTYYIVRKRSLSQSFACNFCWCQQLSAVHVRCCAFWRNSVWRDNCVTLTLQCWTAFYDDRRWSWWPQQPYKQSTATCDSGGCTINLGHGRVQLKQPKCSWYLIFLVESENDPISLLDHLIVVVVVVVLLLLLLILFLFGRLSSKN